jgi:hypothetical protein
VVRRRAVEWFVSTVRQYDRAFTQPTRPLEQNVKKGRHRRFEEARALKRGPDVDIESILDDSDEEDDDSSVNGRAGWYEDDEDQSDD